MYIHPLDGELNTIISFLALGGGLGDFGLIVHDGFLQGSSGPCSTFGNPALIPGMDGSFDILDFELYGMVPYMASTNYRIDSSS